MGDRLSQQKVGGGGKFSQQKLGGYINNVPTKNKSQQWGENYSFLKNNEDMLSC